MTAFAPRLQEALRHLLLPVPPDDEEAAVAAADQALAAAAVPQDDRAFWVANEHAAWRESGVPSPGFADLVGAYVEAGDPDLGPDLAASYFSLHDQIRNRPLFDFDRASALLSHARLIGSLAWHERMTAAQVTRVVNARDPRLELAWPVAQLVLTALRLRPALDDGDVQVLFGDDTEFELEAFADADDATALRMVADLGERLGLGPELHEALNILLPPAAEPFGPYLQMLHYQCVIAEFYDHQLSAIYEFSPRGAIPEWLFSQYPPALIGAGNPFLNNAKSVDTLDRGWASSKKDAQTRQAHALVTVIDGLDKLGHAARKEIAAWMRRLIVRRMRLAQGTHNELPSVLSRSDVSAICAHISSGESRTQGIIEQRLVDVVAASRHPGPNWVGRGLSDSVNATNVSRRKLGDCDFQNSASGSVMAYEAHAGRLTSVYAQGHARTLAKALHARVSEWEENFGAGKAWSVEVLFVAHEVALSELALSPVSVGPVTATLRAVTYADFLAGVDPSDPEVLENAQKLLRDPMALPRTPDSARGALLAMLP